MRTHLLTFFVAFSFVGAVAASCGTPSATCSATSCTGCCDASGQCQSAGTALACGTAGAACAPCALGASCVAGVCSTPVVVVPDAGTSADFCNDYYAAQYDTAERCGIFSAAGAAEARANYLKQCASFVMWPGLKDGRQTYSAANAASCISAIRTLACNANTNSTAVNLSERCNSVVAGAVPLNGSCFGNEDCATGLQCLTTSACPGTCAPRIANGQTVISGQSCLENSEPYNGMCTPIVAIGQSCAPTGGATSQRSCVIGASCSAADLCVAEPATFQDIGQPCGATGQACGTLAQCVGGVCTKYVVVGGACSSTVACQYDLHCTAANTCARAGVAGATCDNTNPCASNLFCNVATGQTAGTCAAIRTVDQSCGSSGQCTDGLYCTGAPMTPGVCKAKLAAGAACPTDHFDACGTNLYCNAGLGATTGVCAMLKANDATCTSGNECQGYCNNGTCTGGYCSDPTP